MQFKPVFFKGQLYIETCGEGSSRYREGRGLLSEEGYTKDSANFSRTNRYLSGELKGCVFGPQEHQPQRRRGEKRRCTGELEGRARQPGGLECQAEVPALTSVALGLRERDLSQAGSGGCCVCRESPLPVTCGIN